MPLTLFQISSVNGTNVSTPKCLTPELQVNLSYFQLTVEQELLHRHRGLTQAHQTQDHLPDLAAGALHPVGGRCLAVTKMTCLNQDGLDM